MRYYLIAILSFFSMIPIQAKVEAPIRETLHLKPVEVDTITYDTALASDMEEYPLFDFNTFDIELHEGCTDSLVYPGGMSGPTISCGLDLGNIGSKNIDAVLGASVPDSVKEILEKASGVNGESSISWIRRNQVHLGEKTARRICNALKKHIWNLLTRKYENLNSAPPQVKTAMLDIAFQAGVGSTRMDGFGKAIEAKNWRLLGQMIRSSYSDFEGGKYHSIHRRRVDHGMQIEFIYNPPKNVAIDYD